MSRALVGAFAVLVAACGAAEKPPIRLPMPPVPPVAQPARPPAPRSPVALDAVLAFVDAAYVDPTRVRPRALLLGALDALAREVPEAVVEIAADGENAVVQVNDRRLAIAVGDVTTVGVLSARLTQVIEFAAANVNRSTDPAKTEYAAVNGLLAALDPHSELMDPEALREFDVGLSGKFGGIGIVLANTPGTTGAPALVVDRVNPNGPAATAGVLAGDRIVAIAGQSTEGFTIDDAIERLRGKPGTEVGLTLARKDAPDPIQVAITRAEITIAAVESQVLAKRVGYLRVLQFSEQAATEATAAFATLRGAGVTAWILDLRDNPGGLLGAAVTIADLFVDEGTIVTTVSSQQRDTKLATAGGDVESPLVVLVSSGTASSGEILAGALAHLGRAAVVGETSFGKGSVQILYDTPGGTQLKLTVAQYLSGPGVAVQGVGVVPDLELRPAHIPAAPATPSDRVRLDPPPAFRERDIARHLVDATAVERAPASTLPYLAPAAEPRDAADDFAVTFATDLVLAGKHATRDGVLADGAKVIAATRAKEAAKIAAALATLGVDWKAAKKTAKKTALAATVTTTAAGAVAAGDTVTLTAVVKNTGKAPAHGVHLRTTSEDPAFAGIELVLGRIDAGASRTATIDVPIPRDAPSHVAALAFTVEDRAGSPATIAPLELAVAGAPRPTLAFGWQLVDDGNGDGFVQAGEALHLHVRVKNTGAGVAPAALVTLASGLGERILVATPRSALGELAPGAEATLDLALATASVFAEKALVLRLAVTDGVFGGGGTQTFEVPLAPSVTVAAATGAVAVGSAAVDVRGAAARTAPVIASAPPGSVLAVTGRAGDLVRVELAPGLPGFVEAAKVADVTDATRTRVDTAWQSTPPDLTVTAAPTRTTDATVTVRGEATDAGHVEDLYILARPDAASVGTKVFYRSNRGGADPTRLDFAASVPLAPGMNELTIVARESDSVRTTRVVWIYRAP
jgi:carboxyl-terminal processing protease